MSDVFVVTGERSGDEQAARLLKSFPYHTMEGVTGPNLRALNIKEFLPMESLQVMGFFDVLLHLPRILWIMHKITQRILTLKPKFVFLVDYPGMNLRLAARLKKKGFKGKIIQVGCPTVWAWGKKRIPKMEANLDVLLTFFPFEASYFNQEKLLVKFIGHPLATQATAAVQLQKTGIAIFPGSRKKEIERNLPIQLEVMKKIFEISPEKHFFLSLSQDSFRPLYEKLLAQAKIPTGLNYSLIKSHQTILAQCEYAIAKSGTITLELALAKIPTVVMYAISARDVFLATKVFRINLPHYCIVNILLNKTVFPEFIGPSCTVKNILEAVFQLKQDPILDNLQALLKSDWTVQELQN